jgi:hypothetical protein
MPDFGGAFLHGVLGLLRQPAVIITLAVMVMLSVIATRRRR